MQFTDKSSETGNGLMLKELPENKACFSCQPDAFSDFNSLERT